jgi:hypothetical protein
MCNFICHESFYLGVQNTYEINEKQGFAELRGVKNIIKLLKVL